MPRTTPMFQDESPFALDELPRLHPLFDERDRRGGGDEGEESEDELRAHDEEGSAPDWRAGREEEPELESSWGDEDVGPSSEHEDSSPSTFSESTRAQRRTDIERVRRAFDAGTPEKKLADLVFAARYPGRKATDSAELRAVWHDLDGHLVPVALQGGRFRGPLHGDSSAAVAALRKGGSSAVISPQAIWPRGLQPAEKADAPLRKVGAVVIHTTGRSGRSKASKYKKAAIEFATSYYLDGVIGPHYVIDLNGTIVGIADERKEKGHVGWSRDVAGGVKVSYRKIFSDPHWSPPAWWKLAWPATRTPIQLLPKGASHPNQLSIGIELVPLPDRTFTPEQYWALGKLLAELGLRYATTLDLSSVPGKGVLGHEDYSPLAQYEPDRIDKHGGRDPGGHSSTPRFIWALVAAELAVARAQLVVDAASKVGHAVSTLRDSLELDEELDGEGERECDHEDEPSDQWGDAEDTRESMDDESCPTCGASSRIRTLPTCDGECEDVHDEELFTAAEMAGERMLEEEDDDAGSDAAAGAPAALADVPLGRLEYREPDGGLFTYQFTTADLEWSARFLEGEAGDTLERSVVLWMMVNRLAFRQKPPTFSKLLRAYSTPLQYPLNNMKAAYRHWKKCPGDECQFVDLSDRLGYYDELREGVKVPKGQLRHFIALQRRPWAKLTKASRRIAASVLSGQLKNAAGIATEFDDTAVYYHDHHDRWPTRKQWLTFTKNFAKQKKYLWPSEKAPYDQFRHNVIFVEKRYGENTAPTIVASGAAVSSG